MEVFHDTATECHLPYGRAVAAGPAGPAAAGPMLRRIYKSEARDEMVLL